MWIKGIRAMPGMIVAVTRLIMIAAVAFCGNRYLRIERDRREAADFAQEELLDELRRRQMATR